MSNNFIRKDFKLAVDNFKVYVNKDELNYAYRKLGLFGFIFFVMIYFPLFFKQQCSFTKNFSPVLAEKANSLRKKEKKRKKRNNKKKRKDIATNVHDISVVSKAEKVFEKKKEKFVEKFVQKSKQNLEKKLKRKKMTPCRKRRIEARKLKLKSLKCPFTFEFFNSVDYFTPFNDDFKFNMKDGSIKFYERMFLRMWWCTFSDDLRLLIKEKAGKNYYYIQDFEKTVEKFLSLPTYRYWGFDKKPEFILFKEQYGGKV